MAKVAVIGNGDSVKGFSALGFSVFETESAEEASRIIKKLSNNDFAVIYITEKLFSICDNEISKYINNQTPAIIPIPGTDGNTGIGIQNVKRSVERAVGSDIIFGD